jgi:hypothetical protein
MGKVAASLVDSLYLSQVMLIWNPGLIFVFAGVKMYITPKKQAKIVALNEHINDRERHCLC